MKILDKYYIKYKPDYNYDYFLKIDKMLNHQGYERRHSRENIFEEWSKGTQCITYASDRVQYSTYNKDVIEYEEKMSQEMLDLLILQSEIAMDGFPKGEFKIPFVGRGYVNHFFGNDYYLKLMSDDDNNDKIFNIFNIDDKMAFVKYVLGYAPGDGDFPTVKSKEDLTKVIIKMIDYFIEPFDYTSNLAEEKDSKKPVKEVEFEIGDIVSLNKEGISVHGEQYETINKGTITDTKEGEIRVLWDAGGSFYYFKRHLKLFDSFKEGVYKAVTSKNTFIVDVSTGKFISLEGEIICEGFTFYIKNYKYFVATEFEQKLFEFCIKQNKVYNPWKLHTHACEKYPIGTKFKIAHIPDEIRTVKSHNMTENWCIINSNEIAINLETVEKKNGCEEASVFTKNHGWAEIVGEKIDPNVFKKGEYVVMLQGSNGDDTWWDSMPIDHVYKLREDSSSYVFKVEKNINGNSDGWDNIPENVVSKLKLRKATEREIELYNEENKPIHIRRASSDETIKTKKECVVTTIENCGFKEGDKVLLNEKGIERWGNQSNGEIGIILSVGYTSFDSSWRELSNLIIGVKWKNENTNYYPPQHLELCTKSHLAYPLTPAQSYKKTQTNLKSGYFDVPII